MRKFFNRFEWKKLVVIFCIIGAVSLGTNVCIAVLQVNQCNDMSQRYIDIINLSILILLEATIACVFIYTIRNNRRSTWTKTRVEIWAIVAGIISSFLLKIIIKATHRSRSQSSQFGKDSAVNYHIESFL